MAAAQSLNAGGPTAGTATDAPVMLSARGLRKEFGGFVAVNNVDLDVRHAQVHALIGPNGAGKSTLFGLISRLLRIQQGDIRLDGSSLKHAPSRVLQQIGMVFQQSTLDLDLSVEDNLNYHACLHGIDRATRRQRIDVELERGELSDQRRCKVRQLNGGHRRRVEIARALLHQPRLLLLDEASVGLDSRSRSDINRHVRSLCRDQGVGVLWATHLIEEIQPHDPVTLLHQGQLLANASAEAICQHSGQDSLVKAFESLTAVGEHNRFELNPPQALCL
ncbi:MAG: ATP-binding cassette domain-containing protein [Halopseudomonas sp.]